MSYFPHPYSCTKNIKLPNYSTISDLKWQTGIEASKFAKKVDLAGLNQGADKLDIDKLKNCSKCFK